MAAARKVIITCAVTGSVHTPSMSPYLPITPSEIAEQAIEAAEAGAAILHLHARDPETGRPSASADLFMEFLPSIKQGTDAVVNITTGGSMLMTMDERLEAAHRVQPEICSLNMGTMNFGLFPAADKIKDYKFDWEKPFLEGSKNSAMSNTFGQIENILREVGEAYGTRFEFECYDVGHLHTLKFYYDRGLLKGPLLVQGVFGVLGGISADPQHILHMRDTAQRLFGEDHYFSALGAGRSQIATVTMSALLGGHVRVGLEDSLYIGVGALAQRNADQVRKIRFILEELGFEIATPAEARAMLHLKGADRVEF